MSGGGAHAFPALIALALALAGAGAARAQDPSRGLDSPEAVRQAMADASRLSDDGRHYEAALTYFNVYTAPGAEINPALGLTAENMLLAGFPNAASYFFIKTLQSGDRGAIRRVVRRLPELMDAVGGDLLRPYVLRHTSEADYDADTRAHFFYFLGKDDLLKGDPARALGELAKAVSGGGVAAPAAYLRGTAYAIMGQVESAIEAFRSCQRLASRGHSRPRAMSQEHEDLEARCTAGLARARYQAGSHDLAEETYDEIPKSSFVWTDILFEQAWNAYAKSDYNRALGKLVTYRSPSLSFVFNPEVDVLRAQSFLALCAYDDVNKSVNEFNSAYAGVGGRMKDFLVSHDRDLGAFYRLAAQTYREKLHTQDMLGRALNRFIRGPYFAGMLAQERATARELARARELASRHQHRRFAEFLENVLAWRLKSIHLLGGLFVRNSLHGLYQDLLADLDKMSFIKLEMLNRTKAHLEKRQAMSEDEDGVLKRGTASVSRRDYQYFWTFNGEFWLDELGDYVFALESQCGT